jgi:hypothetical protein
MGVIESDAYHDQAIEAAFLHSRIGCYFIGPYARRVSFASQQIRALDLIRALELKGKLPRKERVAVVGGGIAGLTAVAALRGRKCKVDLYEASETVLMRQRQASHRVVHPTIARWPMEPLGLTTEFPVYDWAAAPCSDVMDVLLEEWRRFFEPHPGCGDELCVFPDGKVEMLLPRRHRGNNEVRLKVNGAVLDQAYQLVIVTVGYGAEAGDGDQPVTSYWTPDELERRRRAGVCFAVGGCGDGGLIDALRLAHNHFHGGWLAFAVAERLSSLESAIPERIAKAEHDALMMFKSLACMSTDPAKEMPVDDLMLKPLYDAYQDAVEDLPPEIEDMLTRSLNDGPDMVGKIQLIAPESQPTVPFAAPIHKLMLLHAIKENVVQWEPSSKIVFKEGGFVRTSNGSAPDEPLDGWEVIQRRGALPALRDFLSGGETTTLRLRQFMLADRIDRNRSRDFSAPAGYPTRSKNLLFINSRYRAARALVASVDPRYHLDADEGGFTYVLTSSAAEPLPESGASVGVTLPKTLFGILPAETAPLSCYELLRT